MLRTIKNWLFENSNDTCDYGCVMLYGRLKEFNQLQSELEPKDVHTFENEIHITVLHGLTKKNNTQKISDCIKSFEFSGESITLDKIDLFQSSGSDDVVKLNVVNDGRLIEFRKQLMSKFENEQTHHQYNLHITLAYVKEGYGEKCVRDLSPCVEFVPTAIVYVPPTDGHNSTYELRIPIGWK